MPFQTKIFRFDFNQIFADKLWIHRSFRISKCILLKIGCCKMVILKDKLQYLLYQGVNVARLLSFGFKKIIQAILNTQITRLE